MLAQPAERFPGSILNNVVFRAFPFLLPNIFTALLSFTSLILVYLYLPETYKLVDVEQLPSTETDLQTIPSVRKSIKTVFLSSLQCFRFSGAWNLLKRKRVFYPCLAYCIVSLTSIIFDEVLVLYAMSTPDSGGLGFSHLRVGYSTSITGIPMMVTTFIVTPYFNKIYPSATCFLYGELLGAFFSFIVICLPIIYHHSKNALITVFILVATGGKCCAVVAFSSVFLLINDSVDSDERGTVNGLSVTLAGLSKAFGPVIGSVLFAWSISNGLPFPFNYSFVFLLNALIGVGGFFLPLRQLIADSEVEERRLVHSTSADETSDYDPNEIQLVENGNQSEVIDEEDEDKDGNEIGEQLLLDGMTRSDGVRETFYLRRK